MSLELSAASTANRIISMLQQRYPIEFPLYQTDWDANGDITPIGRKRRELAIHIEVVFDEIEKAYARARQEEDTQLLGIVSGALAAGEVSVELLERATELVAKAAVVRAAAEKASTPA